MTAATQQSFSIRQNLGLLQASLINTKPITDRLDLLRTHMEQTYDLVLRDDSRLAWSFAFGYGDIESVAQELWYTKLLYTYSDYESVCRETLPVVKSNLFKRVWHQAANRPPNPVAVQRTWDHIQNFVIPSIQLESMVKLMSKANMLTQKLTQE